MNHPRLDLCQFQGALAAANRHFAKIRKKYPNLRAYLVLSLRGAQTKLDGELADSIREFPSLLLESTAKIKTLELIKKLKPKESTKSEQIQFKEEIKNLAKDLEFDGRVQVELRFHDLDYDLIWKLQSDDLVDRELPPPNQSFHQYCPWHSQSLRRESMNGNASYVSPSTPSTNRFNDTLRHPIHRTRHNLIQPCGCISRLIGNILGLACNLMQSCEARPEQPDRPPKRYGGPGWTGKIANCYTGRWRRVFRNLGTREL